MIRVLVVDDDFMVAKVHSGFVSRIDGFEVCGVAHSAETALAAVGELQPDLVLLDVHLPGTTGLDLIAPFRELAPELDVLVITSEREAGSVKKALRSGVVHRVSSRNLSDQSPSARSRYSIGLAPSPPPKVRETSSASGVRQPIQTSARASHSLAAGDISSTGAGPSRRTAGRLPDSR